MKTNLRNLFLILSLVLSTTGARAQSHTFAQFDRYAEANARLAKPAKGEKRVVFLGNSITDNWASMHPEFFSRHGYTGRGISGQTSYQFLLRFRQDVINLHPSVVVINYGTNDIAENTGPYDEETTFGNVVSMVELARYNKIKVVLTSCLPARSFGWRPQIKDGMAKIRHLNARVKAYAEANHIPYVDYFTAMLSADGQGMKQEYTPETVHPNLAGYAVMEALIVPVVSKLL
ncbi:GDSL-type esterase/lipase family protein [Prevotella sp. kh1p2]|uniref:GDSL-type esterase/lipase family protein n=1 Tax=Prevotella sp. kh1p2 TaxID=1761883 RepID=UPI0008AC1222|nr:GDSL-type esterase/lipase family protein [Prevotella sp. kh1p2]SET17192.1 Lysophospholipase L1 [Prevotella sp. kh1p2]SNU12067.1 Lysophospholipase L1 [Prevotellaceae bacterium KH2P17]